MNRIPSSEFSEFIEFFPVLELPFSLLPDISQIPTDAVPLPDILLDAYILPFEGTEVDEFTEYIPYGRIAGSGDYHAIIYWKAGVLQYEFILATFTLDGQPISHAIIGGIVANEEGMLHSVAVIHEDLTITIAEGVAVEEEENEDLSQTNTYEMAVEPSGNIIYEINDEDSEG